MKIEKTLYVYMKECGETLVSSIEGMDTFGYALIGNHDLSVEIEDINKDKALIDALLKRAATIDTDKQAEIDSIMLKIAAIKNGSAK